MKKSLFMAALVAAVATGAWFGFSSDSNSGLTPAQTANLDALTNSEIIVEYDKNCAAGGPDVCVPNWYTYIRDQYVYK